MLRLCSKSSRSYPGRPVRHAVRILTAPDAATYRVIGQESAEIILGAGETSRTKVRRKKLPLTRFAIIDWFLFSMLP